jgi:hypothetical protein
LHPAANALRDGLEATSSADQQMVALAEQIVSSMMGHLGCSPLQRDDASDPAMRCALSALAAWLLQYCGQLGAPGPVLWGPSMHHPLRLESVEVVTQLLGPSR